MENVFVYQSKDELAKESARAILKLIQKTIEEKGRCNLVLTGGHTPVAINEQIVNLARRYRIDWSLVHFFWGDERHVPPDHPDSNYKMNYETLLIHLPVSDSHIHRIQAELTPDVAAKQYEEEIKRVFNLKENEIPEFDILLLGMGPDGHTASLFPGTSALVIENHLVVQNYVDKLNTYRITMTYPVINKAKHVLFLVTGSEKKETLKTVWQAPKDIFKYPAQGVSPKGELYWYIDQQSNPSN